MVVKNAMRDWVAAATTEELTLLARHARTTVGTLRQLAGGYRTKGRPAASSELASRVELASKKLARPGLKPVMRGELCAACAQCDVYRKQLS